MKNLFDYLINLLFFKILNLNSISVRPPKRNNSFEWGYFMVLNKFAEH